MNCQAARQAGRLERDLVKPVLEFWLLTKRMVAGVAPLYAPQIVNLPVGRSSKIGTGPAIAANTNDHCLK